MRTGDALANLAVALSGLEGRIGVATAEPPTRLLVRATETVLCASSELQAIDDALNRVLAPTQVYEPNKGVERPLNRVERITLLVAWLNEPHNR